MQKFFIIAAAVLTLIVKQLEYLSFFIHAPIGKASAFQILP